MNPILLLVLALLLPIAPLSAALNDDQKAALAAYGKVRSALVAMDLAGARAAAGEAAALAGIPEVKSSASELAAATTMKDARKAFQKWSDLLLPLTSGEPGYYTAHCPMVKGTWIQTDRKITNPYAGDSMPNCGALVVK